MYGETRMLADAKKRNQEKIVMMTESGQCLELQKERLLSEARSEGLKYNNQTGMAEDYIRELKSQVGSQEMDFRSAMEGRAYSRRQQDVLHEELADRERALRDTQIR